MFINRGILTVFLCFLFLYSLDSYSITHSFEIIYDDITAEPDQAVPAIVDNKYGDKGVIFKGNVKTSNNSGAAFVYSRSLLPFESDIIPVFHIADSSSIIAGSEDEGADTDALVFSRPDDNDPIKIGKSSIDGIIESKSGAAIRIESDTIGNLLIGESAIIKGKTGIENISSFTGNITTHVMIEGTGGTSVDFSDSNSPLLLILNGEKSGVRGDVLGSDHNGDTIFVNGGTIMGDTEDVDVIRVSGDDDYSAFSGDVRGTQRARFEVNGSLKIGNDLDYDTYSWFANYEQSGQVLFAVKDIHRKESSNSPKPVVKIDGSATIDEFSSIGLAGRGIYTPKAGTYQLMEADSIDIDDEVEFYSFWDEGELSSSCDSGVCNLNVFLLPKSSDEIGDGLEEASEQVIEPLAEVVKKKMTEANNTAIQNLNNALSALPSEKVTEELAKQLLITAVTEATVQATYVATSVIINQLISRAFYSVLSSPVAIPAGDQEPDTGFWFEALHSNAHQNARKNSKGTSLQGFNTSVDGVTLGLETDLDNSVVGVAATTGNSSINIKREKDADTANFYQLSFYGSWEKNGWFVNPVVSVGWSDTERKRYVDGFSDTPLSSEFRTSNAKLHLLSGKVFPVQGFLVQPLIGFNYSYTRSEGYSEEDSANTGFAQKVNSQSSHKFEVGMGAEIASELDMWQGRVIPSVRLMGWYDFRGQQTATTSKFLVGSREFTIKGADPVRESYSATASITYQKEENMEVSLEYERNQKTGYSSDNVSFNFRYDF